jgi:predicted dehydrogenase
MLNLAIVGCGGMANAHATNLSKLSERARVVALCDIIPSRTAAMKEKFFKEAAEFESFNKMIETPQLKLDGVILVTPHTLHYEHAKSALEHGVNVLVEKPMVTSSEHAYDLWKTVKRSGKLLGIAYQASYSNEFGYLAAQRDAGQLGKVQLVSAWMAQNWLSGTKGSWRQDPSQSGGGQMYDSGAHVLNAIMWLMNEPVVEVSCMYDKCGSPVDINGVAIARFQGGALASVCIGGNCPMFRTEIQIQTDKYLILADQYGAKLEMSAAGRRVYPRVDEDLRPGAGTPQANFINAITDGEALRAPVRYGVLLSALMDAMYESAAKQGPVKVKPVPTSI